MQATGEHSRFLLHLDRIVYPSTESTDHSLHEEAGWDLRLDGGSLVWMIRTQHL